MLSTSPVPVFAFGGCHRLGTPSCRLAGAAALALAQSGACISTGCARGADAAVMHALIAAGRAAQLRVLCAFGPVLVSRGLASAQGTCTASAPLAVARAGAAGARVSPWAGGPASVPLAGRLAQRTKAVAQLATAGACIVVQHGLGPGSLLLAQSVAARGLPVFVLSAAPSGDSLPLLCAGPGPWQRVSAGPLARLGAWAWLPQQQLSLLSV